MKCWKNISPLLHAVFLTLFWFTLCLPSSENSATSIFEPGSHFLRILSLFCCKCCKYDLFIADFSLPQCNSRLAKCQDGIFNFFYSWLFFWSPQEINTAEPCSCLLFTSNSLLAGTDRFYQIDLDQYQVDGEQTLDLDIFSCTNRLRCGCWRADSIRLFFILIKCC